MLSQRGHAAGQDFLAKGEVRHAQQTCTSIWWCSHTQDLKNLGQSTEVTTSASYLFQCGRNQDICQSALQTQCKMEY